MKTKIYFFAGLASILFGFNHCGSSSSETTPEATGLSSAAAVTITGVTTASDFTTNGEFTVGFTATDSGGTSILASTKGLSTNSVISDKGGWLTVRMAALTSGVSCTITDPASGVDCILTDDVTSTSPSGGNGNVASATVLDDSGSMIDSDPDNDRGTAANTFLDSLCATDTNFFGVFDFGAGSNLSFTETRDLLTADSSSVTGTLPYIECSASNVTTAKTAIANQVGANIDTPLYESVLEVCNDMVSHKTTGGTLDGKALAMLILSDGQPNDNTNKSAAEACLTDNSITACTVGLGPGSELDVLVDSDAVDALKDLSTAGSCVYSAATDVSALETIFDAIGVAVTTGQNFAVLAASPIPASGTTVSGTLTVGSASATFTFVAP